MRIFSRAVTPEVWALLVVGMVSMASIPPSFAAPGRAPTAAQCKSKPRDAVTAGGCIVISKKLGNCMACHAIAGTSEDGNLGPPLRHVPGLMGSKQALYQQLWDPQKNNPNTAMPPFGKNRILTKKQIHQVVDFLWTL